MKLNRVIPFVAPVTHVYSVKGRKKEDSIIKGVLFVTDLCI